MNSNRRKAQRVKLFEAVMSDNIKEVAGALKLGVHVDERDADGFTALMLSASRGFVGLTRYLISNGADVNLRNEIGQTALMIAARTGHKTLVLDLLATGADIHALDKEKRGVVAWATTGGDFPDLLSVLLERGADCESPDSQGITPLMRAALQGSANSVATLLAAGADPTIRYKGNTACDMAFQKGFRDLCKTMKGGKTGDRKL